MRDQQSSMPSPRVCTSPARNRVAHGEAGLASFGFAGCDGDDSGDGITQFQLVERPHEGDLRRRGAGSPQIARPLSKQRCAVRSSAENTSWLRLGRGRLPEIWVSSIKQSLILPLPRVMSQGSV
jgi:hypothetical protein